MTINMDEYQIDIHSYLGKLLMVDINSILNLQKVSSEDEEAEPEEIGMLLSTALTCVDFDELERKLCDEHYADDDWGYDENNDVDESKEDLLNQLTDKELNYVWSLLWVRVLSLQILVIVLSRNWIETWPPPSPLLTPLVTFVPVWMYFVLLASHL